MKKETLEIYKAIDTELLKAEEVHPHYPVDIYQQLAILTEEAGEVAKAVLHYTYEGGSLEDVQTELKQTAAMCVRMLQYYDEPSRSKNQDDEDTKNIDVRNLPPFVKMGSHCLRLKHDDRQYYRDGGRWSIGYKIKDGVLVSKGFDGAHDIGNVPLIKCSEQEWRNDNGEYAPEKIEMTVEFYSSLKKFFITDSEAIKYRFPIVPIINYDGKVLVKFIGVPAPYILEKLTWLKQYENFYNKL